MNTKRILVFATILVILAVSYIAYRMWTGQVSKKSAITAPVGGETANITIDFSKEKGEFSPYLFGFAGPPKYDREVYKSAREMNFKFLLFKDSDLVSPDGFNPDQAKALADGQYNYAVILNVGRVTAPELEHQTQGILDALNLSKTTYPNLKDPIFLFGNEPDLDNNQTESVITDKKKNFFEGYAVFAKYLKSKNANYIVGGMGFANAVVASNQTWIKEWIEYCSKNNIPLDFVAYHGYSSEVKIMFPDGLNNIKGMLAKYPKLSPLYGTPKIALSEFDIVSTPAPCGKNYPEEDSSWRAAHNIMTLLSLAENGLWMASEMGAPARDPNYSCYLWLKSDGTKKPIYYAHQAYNSLVGRIQLAQEGSNFETFGAAAGKSKDGNYLAIVLANYDQYSFLDKYPSDDPISKNVQQTKDAKIYKDYSISIKNLPWTPSDKLVLERYAVDDTHKMDLIETEEIVGSPQLSIEKSIDLPQVQLIKIYKK